MLLSLALVAGMSPATAIAQTSAEQSEQGAMASEYELLASSDSSTFCDDENDIGKCSVDLPRGRWPYIHIDGYHQNIDITLTLNSSEGSRQLVQDQDFYIDGYALYDYTTNSYTPIEGLPDQKGTYQFILKPCQGSGLVGTRTVQLYVSDYRDLGNWTCENRGTCYFDGDELVSNLALHVQRFDGTQCVEELKEGTDFVLSGFTQRNDSGSWAEVVSEPTSPGTWYAVLEPANGSAYVGTGHAYIDVRDTKDLSLYNCSSIFGFLKADGFHSKQGNYIAIRDSNGEEHNAIYEGEAFRISKFYSGSYQNWVEIDGYPTKEGSYYVEIVPVEGSGYTGSAMKYIQVYDFSDLSRCSYSSSSGSWMGNRVIAPSLSLYFIDYDGNKDFLTEGVDYRITSIVKSGQSQPQETYDGPGRYTITISAIPGSGYSGSRTITVVVEERSLSNATWSISRQGYIKDGVYHDPSYSVSIGDVTLIAGSDYVVSHYEKLDSNYNRVRIDGEPTESGNYYLVLVPAESSALSGSCSVYTRVKDYASFDSWDLTMEGGYYDPNGVFVKPTYSLTRLEEDGTVSTLQEGKDFSVTPQYYYETPGGNKTSTNTISSPGYYTLKVDALAGSGYEGSSFNYTVQIVSYKQNTETFSEKSNLKATIGTNRNEYLTTPVTVSTSGNYRIRRIGTSNNFYGYISDSPFPSNPTSGKLLSMDREIELVAGQTKYLVIYPSSYNSSGGDINVALMLDLVSVASDKFDISSFSVSSAQGNTYLVRYAPAQKTDGRAFFRGQGMHWLASESCWALLVTEKPELTAADFSVEGKASDASVIARPNYAGKDAVPGDVNGNGVLNVVDAQAAYDVARGIYRLSSDTQALFMASDANGDRVVDAADARALQLAALSK